MTQNTLARLARCVKEAQDELGQIRISGSISEVTPAYARVAGLSRFLKLGECVSFSAGGLTQLAEVVRIDELGATVKTFDTMALARLGERVLLRRCLAYLSRSKLEWTRDQCPRCAN